MNVPKGSGNSTRDGASCFTITAFFMATGDASSPLRERQLRPLEHSLSGVAQSVMQADITSPAHLRSYFSRRHFQRRIATTKCCDLLCCFKSCRITDFCEP